MSRPPWSASSLAALAMAIAAVVSAGCSRGPSEATRAAPAAVVVTRADTLDAGVAPVVVRAPAIPDRPLRVIVGGDLLPHRPSLLAPSAIRAALAPLGPLFATADAVVVNYETATGELDPKALRLAYAAPPGWLEELPKAGIGAITIANNHTCDLGLPGLDATLDAASKCGLVTAGGDAADPWTPRVVAERGGKRICVVAWTTLSNGDRSCTRRKRVAFASLDRAGKQRIDRALARAKKTCDGVIAVFHGGDEYAPQASRVMDQAAHAAEAGADAVVIHHPHVASPVVVHTTKDGRAVPLFASVGNLVTNQGESWKPPMFPVLRENRHLVCVNAWTRLGVLADLSFSFDPAGEKRPTLEWGTHLVWVDNEHAQDRTVEIPKIAARLLDPTSDRAILEKLYEDRLGPLALFADPCWIERGATSRPREETCTSARVSAAPANRRANRRLKRATSLRKK